MNAKSKSANTSRRGDKRDIRRYAQGDIKASDDVGRSLSQDRRRKAKTVAKPVRVIVPTTGNTHQDRETYSSRAKR